MDLPRVDLDDARWLRKEEWNTVGRAITTEPIQNQGRPLTHKVLRATADVIEDAEGEYRPVVVDVRHYDGDTDWETVLMFVNVDHPDDVVFPAPLDIDGVEK